MKIEISAKDKAARLMNMSSYDEFVEFRKVTNDFKVETILPLKKQVGDLDANMTTYIHQLQERIQQQDEIIIAITNYLGVKINYTEPDHVGRYEIVPKEDKDDQVT